MLIKRVLIPIYFLALMVLGMAVFYGWASKQAKHDHRYEPLIHEAAQRYHISPDLIRAVIWRESDFDESATGLAHERGLMQVTPVAGREWAKVEKIANFRETDLFDPRTNILAGSWYLSRAISRWPQADRPEIFALAEYNAGRGNARRWAKDLTPPLNGTIFIETIDYPTTKSYISNIVERCYYYQKQPDPSVLAVGWAHLQGYWWRWLERRHIQMIHLARDS